MTETKNVYIDRRTAEEINAGLRIPVFYWYDKLLHGTIFHSVEGQKDPEGVVRRTNALSIDSNGRMIIGRAMCSPKDQFERRTGRIVASNRIFGRAAKHCEVYTVDTIPDAVVEEIAAHYSDMYRKLYASDELGIKRAHHAGRMFGQSFGLE